MLSCLLSRVHLAGTSIDPACLCLPFSDFSSRSQIEREKKQVHTSNQDDAHSIQLKTHLQLSAKNTAFKTYKVKLIASSAEQRNEKEWDQPQTQKIKRTQDVTAVLCR